MNSSKLPVVRACESAEQFNLSKRQKSFNNLIKQIEKKRKLLASWQTKIPEYHARYAAELDPLIQQLNADKREMVLALDKAYFQERLTQKEKGVLRDIVCSMSLDLIDACGYTDLKEIYNRHSGGDFDAEVEEEQEMVRLMAEDFLGISLESDGGSIEEMMAHLASKMKDQWDQERKASQRGAASQAKRKKSAASLAKEARLQEEAKNMTQSVREVYKNLASVLHPDLEQDETERRRKTEMMQRVNVLYNNKDLLGLLELQLEIEQIDQTKINRIAEEKLIYYNKILADQNAKLREEIQAAEMSFRFRFRVSPALKLSPDTLLKRLQKDIKEMKVNIEEINKDISSFQDTKKIKSWLKTMQPDFLSETDRYGAPIRF